jgi:hypothetical protein
MEKTPPSISLSDAFSRCVVMDESAWHYTQLVVFSKHSVHSLNFSMRENKIKVFKQKKNHVGGDTWLWYNTIYRLSDFSLKLG